MPMGFEKPSYGLRRIAWTITPSNRQRIFTRSCSPRWTRRPMADALKGEVHRRVGQQEGTHGTFLRDPWIKGFTPLDDPSPSITSDHLQFMVEAGEVETEPLTLMDAIKAKTLFEETGRRAQI